MDRSLFRSLINNPLADRHYRPSVSRRTAAIVAKRHTLLQERLPELRQRLAEERREPRRKFSKN